MDSNYGDYGNNYPSNYGYGMPSRGGGHGPSYNGYPSAGPPGGAYGGPPGPGFDPNGGQFQQQSPLDAEVASVLHEIRGEIAGFEANPEFGEQYRNAKRLLNSEVTKLENNIDPEWLELDIEKQIKLVKKVLIPAFRYPRFNFVGKVIGPKGVTLQNIAKTFKCHVYVLGRGSSRDKAKEQELLQSGDPQYAHYNGPLHVKIETTAPPALAYKRVAGVLEVLGELLKPVKETYIEGITPMPESMKKEGDTTGDDDDEKKEPVEESKIKIDGDYGQDNDDSKNTSSNAGSNGASRGRGGPPRDNNRGGNRGGRGGRGGGPPGREDPYRGPPSMGMGNRGGGGGPGPMRRGNSSFPPSGFGGMPMGGPRAPMPLMGGRGRGGGRGFGGSRGGDRGGPSRGGRGAPRFQPY